jgi:hypothetical protein
MQVLTLFIFQKFQKQHVIVLFENKKGKRILFFTKNSSSNLKSFLVLGVINDESSLIFYLVKKVKLQMSN